jgi:hypothetical protein
VDGLGHPVQVVYLGLQVGQVGQVHQGLPVLPVQLVKVVHPV